MLLVLVLLDENNKFLIKSSTQVRVQVAEFIT